MHAEKILYPHRIPFAKYGDCDVCRRPAKKMYSLPFSKYLGLVCCENVNCSNILKISMRETTKPLEILIDKFGETVKVKRSNGELEKDWNIISYAYKEEENGDFWVHVSKDKNTKCVTLRELEEWNG